jgi:hypothetical protein
MHNVYITNQFQTTFSRGDWARRKIIKTFAQITSKNSASVDQSVFLWGGGGGGGVTYYPNHTFSYTNPPGL